MNQQILNFLKTYSTGIIEINQLLVSSFLYQNDIKVEKNLFLKQYLISKNSEKYQKVFNFLSHFQNTESFPFELLVELFEFVISPSDKLINGAIYTPWGTVIISAQQKDKIVHPLNGSAVALEDLKNYISSKKFDFEQLMEDYVQRDLWNVTFLMDWAKDYTYHGGKLIRRRLF